MHVSNVEALRSWLINKLGPVCEADPVALSKYVLALVRKDKPFDNVRTQCIDQLQVFLSKDTVDFVDELLEAVRTDSYLQDSKGSRSSASGASLSTKQELDEPGPVQQDSTYPVRRESTTLQDANINQDTPPPEPGSPARVYSRHDSLLDDLEDSDEDDDTDFRRKPRHKEPLVGPSSTSGQLSRKRYDNDYSSRPPFKARRENSPLLPSRSGRGHLASVVTLPGNQNNIPSSFPGRRRGNIHSRLGLPLQRPGLPPPPPGVMFPQGPGLDAMAGMPPHLPPVRPMTARCRDYDEKGFCLRGESCMFSHGSDAVVMDASGAGQSHANLQLAARVAANTGLPGRLGMPVLPLPPPVSAGTNPHLGVIGRPPRLPHVPVQSNADLAYNPEQPAFDAGSSRTVVGVGQSVQRDRELVNLTSAPGHSANSSGSGRGSVHSRLGARAEDNEQSQDPDRDHGFLGNSSSDGVLDSRNALSAPLQSKRQSKTRDEQPRRPFKPTDTLALRKVPVELNNIAKLSEHFQKFGTVVSVQIGVFGDRQAALVKFSTPHQARAAHSSPEPVLNNRFIRVYYHNKDEESQTATSGTSTPQTSVTSSERPAAVAAPATATPVVLPPRGSTSLSHIQENQEKQRKEALQKQKDLLMKSQSLLQNLIKEQKTLIEKLEMKPSKEERASLMKTLKMVNEKINSVQQLMRPGNVKKTLTKSPEGGTMTSVSGTSGNPVKTTTAQEKDKLQAKSLPVQKEKETATPAASGLQARSPVISPTTGRARLPGSCIDRRPRQLLVSGWTEDQRESLSIHFESFPGLEKQEWNSPNNGSVLLTFLTRSDAAKALSQSVVLQSKYLPVTWYTPPPQAESTSETAPVSTPEDKQGVIDDVSKEKPAGSVLEEDEEDDGEDGRAWRR